uniref:Uncharacterized protein LOC104237164 n=1 Tax=Nicotiana sylvestris TaxID=4096 RepID=A0A1U7XIU7_NICSY|nr:PREDICTED: uncharacterized protein LOC104237164 [Nicotiana sylvestris]
MRMTVSVSDNYLGFMSGRSTIEAIHLVRRLVELYREAKKDLYMVFIYLRKHMTRFLFWRCLKAKGVLVPYIMAIKDMYDGGKTQVRIVEGDSENFRLAGVVVAVDVSGAWTPVGTAGSTLAVARAGFLAAPRAYPQPPPRPQPLTGIVRGAGA